jgi:formate hydrogenlyase subunit 6/NADH:ubiquinone oxidoreductase subunit I
MSEQLYGELDFAPTEERVEFGPGEVEIDAEQCDGCILCSVICPAAMIVIEGKKQAKKATLREGQDNCMACACCEAICQRAAIQVVRSYDFGGKWKQFDRGGLCIPRRF